MEIDRDKAVEMPPFHRSMNCGRILQFNCKTDLDSSRSNAIELQKVSPLADSDNKTFSLINISAGSAYDEFLYGAIFINASGNRFQAACGFHQDAGTEFRAAM